MTVNNFDESVKINQKSSWPYTFDHPYRILIIAGLGSGKTTVLLNLVNQQPNIYKVLLYVKDPSESKYQLLINKTEKAETKTLKNPKGIY